MGSFLTTRQTPQQSNENSSAFVAGMHIGASAQGELEKRQADEKATEVANQFAARETLLKEQNANFRKQLDLSKDYAVKGIDLEAKNLDTQEKSLQGVLDDVSGVYSKEQRDAAAVGLQNVQSGKKKLLNSVSVIDPSNPIVATQAQSAYNPSQFAQHSPEYDKTVKEKMAGEISGARIKGRQNKFEESVGLPTNVFLSNQTAQREQAKINSGGGKSKAQQKEEADLLLSAPAALSNYFSTHSQYEAAEKNRLSEPFPAHDKFSEPDPREKTYNDISSNFEQTYAKAAPIYSKNWSLAVQDNPAAGVLLSELQTEDPKKDWMAIENSRPLAEAIGTRMFAAQQTGDVDKFNQLSTIYNRLGLHAIGSPASWLQK